MSNPSYASGLLFTKAHRMVRVHIYDVLGGYGLNPTSWSILGSTLYEPDGIRSSTVASLLSVKPPMVTMLAEDLITSDLIKRVPHHTDRRAKLLVITPKGRKLAVVVEAALTKVIRELLTGLTEAEIATFQKTLETIIQNAEQEK